jgi:glycerol-3-phosphate dehydrogenase
VALCGCRFTPLLSISIAHHSTLSILLRFWCAYLQDGGVKVVGAVVRDNLSGKEHSVYARTVINAAGPFSDEVRHLSQVSSGGAVGEV